jgi:hypothetical protein
MKCNDGPWVCALAFSPLVHMCAFPFARVVAVLVVVLVAVLAVLFKIIDCKEIIFFDKLHSQ